ncbi:MAG: hypothetical protein AAF224_09425 [Pseudomonadota bacterium]
MSHKPQLIISLLLFLAAGCDVADDAPHLYSYEGSYGGEDYSVYMLSLPTDERVMDERKTELIEENQYYRDLSDEAKSEVQFPTATLRFSCDSRDKGAIQMEYSYLQDSTLENVRAGVYVPHKIAVDDFERIINIEIGFIYDTDNAAVRRVFWDAERANQITVETPLTPKTTHPIEVYRSSLSKLIRICRGFSEESSSAALDATVEGLLSHASLSRFMGDHDQAPTPVLMSVNRDCSLSMLRSEARSHACALKRKSVHQVEPLISIENHEGLEN